MPYADPEAARARSQRRYARDREEMLAGFRRRYMDDPAFRERAKARAKARRQIDPEADKARKREYYRRNREQIREAARAKRLADPVAAAQADVRTAAAYRRRRALDPEKVRAQHRETAARRRVRLRGNMVEAVDPQVVWERDEGICGICGEPADRGDWHMDHITAVARGGEHSYANVQVSHPLCNRRKAAR